MFDCFFCLFFGVGVVNVYYVYLFDGLLQVVLQIDCVFSDVGCVCVVVVCEQCLGELVIMLDGVDIGSMFIVLLVSVLGIWVVLYDYFGVLCRGFS